MKNSERLIEAKEQHKPNVLSRVYSKIEKWTAGVFAALCTSFAAVTPASAVKINDNLKTEDMVGGIVGFIIEVAKWMGLVVVAAGIFMFIFAYKDDNAEAQSRAARFAVVGALLLGLEGILKLTGLVE